MDNRSDVREFLTSRRARITPEQAGLTIYGDNRRVPGLRRSEVAALAGMSVEYYTRMERQPRRRLRVRPRPTGQCAAPRRRRTRPPFDLARAAGLGNRAPRRAAPAKIRPSVQRILDATSAPTYVLNARLDILAANPACFALYAGILTPDTLPLNLARFVLLDPRAPGIFLDWDTIADDTVAALRGEAGRNPLDRSLSDLIGELTTRSPDFGARWAKHNVRHHRTAVKRLHNPAIGEIEITGEALSPR